MASQTEILDAIRGHAGGALDAPDLYAGAIARFAKDTEGASIFNDSDACDSFDWWELALPDGRLARPSHFKNGRAWLEADMPAMFCGMPGRCGILVDTDEDRETLEVDEPARVRFVVMSAGNPDLPFICPHVVLVDDAPHDDVSQLSYPDRLRARAGLVTAADATPAQLQRMATHLADIGDGLRVHATEASGGRALTDLDGWYWGDTDDKTLRLALRAVALRIWSPLGDAAALKLPARLRDFGNVLHRGPALALSALAFLAHAVGA